jgi:ATP/maltotriose-dependent transcriptional regulator MalT
MISSRKLIIGSGLTLALLAAGGAGLAQAAGSNDGTGQTLADRIASHFHLSKGDVQKVIQQDRQSHEAQRQQRLEQRLDTAVKQGKLTEAQKTLILNKLKELQSQHEQAKQQPGGKTAAERQAYMKQQRQQLEQWAKDNNIPLQYLRPPGGSRGPHGPPAGGHDNDNQS